MKKNSTTVILVESALMIALSVVLDFFKLWQMPFGGSVTCGMVPLVDVYKRQCKVRAKLLPLGT